MLYRRHIFFETLRASLGATGFFVGIFLAGNAVKDVLQLVASGKMGPLLLLQTLLTLLPSVFSYALPLGMVTAVLLVFGRMSDRNEFLILQVAGLTPARIASPVLLLALLGSALALAVNLFFAPRALHAYRQRLQSTLVRDPLRLLQPQQFIREFPGHILYAGGRDGDALINLNIWEFDGQDRLAGFLHAGRGTFSQAPDSGSLRLDLERGSVERGGSRAGPTTLHFREFSLHLPLERLFSGPGDGQKSLKHRDLWELLAALDGRTPDGSPPLERTPAEIRRARIAVSFALQQRLAMALSVLTLSLLALPLALRVHRSETSANGALALLLALAYYFSMALLSWLQDSPTLRADVLIWLPNAVCATLGSLLFPWGKGGNWVRRAPSRLSS
jgi:lipopolysaccharide export system permease protein